jgi:tetratricopeptide (TPR) repeat protein
MAVSPYAADKPFSQRGGVVARALLTDGTEYEVEQPRPTGIKWAKAPDGGIYVAGLDRNADTRVQFGDKLLEVSANFGDKVWKAESFPQCMMAIKTRIGPVYMKILSRGGNTDVLYMKDERDEYDKERAGGNYGAGTQQEIRNRVNALKKTEKDRKELFDDGVKKFQAGEYREALEQFQMVQTLEPPNYIGDRFERYTEYYKYASYNVACCYSKLEEERAGLIALREALDSGWNDYDKIRTDEPLKFLRQSPKFQPLLDLYDEPIFVNPFKDIKNPFR